jgi:hypothetical protein
MSQFYIYSYTYPKDTPPQAPQTPGDQPVIVTNKVNTSATIIFCENEVSISAIQADLKTFYETHSQTDEIYVFGGEYIKTSLVQAFDVKAEETFRYIPKAHQLHLKDNLYVYMFDEAGKFQLIVSGKNKPSEDIFPSMFNEGLLNIFVSRGGLIESKETHHYVFPSGKHCDKFLRTGNILLHGSEIYFIAFNLLRSYNHEDHKQIFCDTSSINTIAFALVELKRRLLYPKSKLYTMPSIESFSSYEGIVKADGKRLENSLILISASTSGNILDRISEKHPIVKEKDITILYFLGPRNVYLKNKDHILCNLTYSDDNASGVQLYPTYNSSSCDLCAKGSHPVMINGDIMLPESPKIQRIIFTVKDAPGGLNIFVKEFGAHKHSQDNVIKVNYKEGGASNLKYEIYFDFFHVIETISKGKKRYPNFSKKLNDYINQYIPSNVRYFICLPDEGSIALAKYIFEQIKDNYAAGKEPKIVNFDDCESIDEKEVGSAVIVASCISNGKNLLYLSRALRTREHLRLVYFIGLARMTNEELLEFLKSNLRQGAYGKETNSFLAVETFFFDNAVKNTSWVAELEFLKQLSEFDEDRNGGQNSPAVDFGIADRITAIEESMSNINKGMANEIFFESTFDNKPLQLRKNYAFLSFQGYHENISQADTYFTISSILNKVRNSKDGRNLSQSDYLRNLIDPNNFNRFNDGIIQASILRAAHSSELAYHMDSQLSLEMKGILETIIRHNKSEQGEALLEFLYAITTEKLSLKPAHTRELCEFIDQAGIKNMIVQLFKTYIMEVTLEEHNKQQSMFEEIQRLKQENEELKKLSSGKTV